MLMTATIGVTGICRNKSNVLAFYGIFLFFCCLFQIVCSSFVLSISHRSWLKNNVGDGWNSNATDTAPFICYQQSFDCCGFSVEQPANFGCPDRDPAVDPFCIDASMDFYQQYGYPSAVAIVVVAAFELLSIVLMCRIMCIHDDHDEEEQSMGRRVTRRLSGMFAWKSRRGSVSAVALKGGADYRFERDD